MKTWSSVVGLGLVMVLSGPLGGCSSGAHATATTRHSPEQAAPSYWAQTAACWNTVSCCVQRNPLTPVSSCGADPIEAAQILKTLGALNEAAQAATLKGPDVPEREEEGGRRGRTGRHAGVEEEMHGVLRGLSARRLDGKLRRLLQVL
jgi:hypothetical protein